MGQREAVASLQISPTKMNNQQQCPSTWLRSDSMCKSPRVPPVSNQIPELLKCLNYICLLLTQNKSPRFFFFFLFFFFECLKYVKIRLRVCFKQSEAGEFQLKPKLSLCGSTNPELQTKQTGEVDTFLLLTMTNKNQTFLGNYTLKLHIKFQINLR